MRDQEYEPRTGCCGCSPKTSRLAKFLVPSILFIGLACSIYWIMAAALELGLRSKFVVTSKSDSSYDAWTEYYASGNPTYTEYYIFNLTNYNDVLSSGAKPRYEEKGPYTYRFTRKRTNVEFQDGGNQVQFALNTSYFFVPEKSAGDAMTDVIYNMNPAYIGAVATAGGEARLQFGVALAFIGQFITFFNSTLVTDVTSAEVPAVLAPKYEALVKAVGAASFAKAWADDTTATAPKPASQWNGMLVAEVSGAPTNIAADTVASLFNASKGLSLMNDEWASTQAWQNAAAMPSAAASLAAAFSLSTEQVLAVAKWRAAFVSTFDVQAAMLKNKKFDNTTEFTLAQWTDVAATNGVSLSKLYPTRFPSSPEIGVGFPGMLSLQVAHKFLYGPAGILVNASNKVLFAGALLHQSKDLSKIWGITDAQVGNFDTYLFGLFQPYVQPFLAKVKADSQALVARRTVNGWLFTSDDPLLGLLDASLAWHGHFFLNDSSTQVINQPGLEPVYTAFTGKDDIRLLNWVNEFNGNEYLVPQIWNGPERIEGTLASQFHFGIEKGSPLTIWEQDLSRHLALVPPPPDMPQTYDYQGIELYTYNVDPRSMQNSAFYNQINMTGFWNLTAAKDLAPVFVCNPHFYGTNETEWLSKLEGVTPPKPHQHQTVLQVEPVTGTTMMANKRSQVNIFIPEGNTWFNSDFPKGVVYPLVWFDEYGSASSKDVEQYKSEVWLVQDLQIALPIAFGVFGLTLLAMGVIFTTCLWESETICCCTLRRRKQTSGMGPMAGDGDDAKSPLLNHGADV